MLLKKMDIVTKVSFVTIFLNVLLAILKFLAGIISNSGAMISDAIHTLSDVFSTIIVIIGVKLSNKKSDKEHQYGHERLECIASILLSVVLFITGLGIGVNCIEKVFSGDYSNMVIPGVFAPVAAVISVVLKEWMYWYTRKAAKKIDSSAMLADAWHHQSDALSSIGAFIGILGARIGFPVLDLAASFIISICICKAAFDIFYDAVNKLIDRSCSEEIVDKMKVIIEMQDDLIKIDDIKTRLFGNRIYVDVEISLDGNRSLYDTHTVAEKVHDTIEKEFSAVKHCMVHVNPIMIKK